MASKSNGDALVKLGELVEQAVTQGGTEVDPKILKAIKSICKTSDKHVEECYKLLVHQLNQKHAEIRYFSFLICKELFQRSHCFRDNLAADFQQFSKLVLDIDPTSPLPPPPAAAKKLKQAAIKTIKEWNDMYGEAYKKLRIGFNYLKQNRTVDFDDLEAQSAGERQRNQLKEAKIEQLKEKKLKNLQEEISQTETEIYDCIAQMENGLVLLVPDHRECVTSVEQTSDTIVSDLREHGITNPTQTLVIEVKQVEIKVDQDNRYIIESLTDQYRLMTNRFQPLVMKWNIMAAKLGADQQLQHRILDLKASVENLVEKYCELKLPLPSRKTDRQSDDSDSSDLESVVDKEGYEETVSQPIYVPMNRTEEPSDAQPGPSGITERKKKATTSSLAVKSFDIDAYQANQHAVTLPTMSLNQVESFWVAANDDESANDPSRIAAFLTHHIELSEEFEPVKWACRAPLPSGNICPRRDRYKCPLHGPIVARDELGSPLDPNAVVSPSKSQVPEWQDPVLLAEIKAATGVDLTIPVKGKRLKKNKYPNLTDIKALNNTARSRLEKKVFNKSVVKKIAASMDKSDKKNAQGKFRDQWNYAYDT